LPERKRVRVAAYQAPLLEAGSPEALGLIRAQVERCAAEDVAILCCPEAVLGGLADYADDPSRFALAASRLDSVLAPLASETVTCIVGFTEADRGRLYNSAAVFQRGTAVGVYRKRHPAIRRSVYDAGRDVPVFEVGRLTLGLLICNDSNHPELARRIAGLGATVLFIPTNNALPPGRGGPELVAETRKLDTTLAAENRLWVVRADVAGHADGLTSHGSSGIVAPTARWERPATN
jgi:5-aminopentanamidase